MKKTLFLLACAAFCFTNADAQKQIGGDKTIELEFTPFGSNPIGNYGIRARIFTSETMAIRAQVDINSNTNTTVLAIPNTEPFGASQSDRLNPELYFTTKSSQVGIMPGIEMHMEGTDNLSPYIGGVVDISFGSNSYEEDHWGANDLQNVEDYSKYVQWSETWSQSWSGFGLGAVLGFDYYFVDNLYLGAEMMIGFQSMKYKGWEYQVSDDVAYSLFVSNGTDNNVDLHPNDWNMTDGQDPATVVFPFDRDSNSFGMQAQGTLRLGWIFAQ